MKIFFGNFICSTHQKKLFYKLSGSFRKIEFLTENLQPRTLQKWWKFCTISKCTQNVLRKYFSAKLFVPLIKRSVSTIFKAVFGKLNFWQKIHSRGPYKNGENFVLSQNSAKKIFFGKILCSTHQRIVSTNFKAVVKKLNFWLKIHSRGPYKNGENFVLSQNELRKYFLAKFFVPLIKRSVSTNFKAGFGKLNFWRKIHSRGPYKNGENFVLSQNTQNAKKIFFQQNYLFHSSKEVFLQSLRQFLENWIFDRKSTAADLTKMVKILYYLKMC